MMSFELLKRNKTLQNYSEVTVTPTFKLYFYALETLPSNLDVSL